MIPLAIMALVALVRLTYVAAWVDTVDGTTCTAYRVGSREVDVCKDVSR